jgi:hypothetical protein
MGTGSPIRLRPAGAPTRAYRCLGPLETGEALSTIIGASSKGRCRGSARLRLVHRASRPRGRSWSPKSRVRDFLPVLFERHARNQLLAYAQVAGRAAKPVAELLFVCVHDAARSQMAAALAEHLYASRVPSP